MSRKCQLDKFVFEDVRLRLPFIILPALCARISLPSGFAAAQISQRHVVPCVGLHLKSGAMPNSDKLQYDTVSV
jgi:hypothetical protein